SKDRPTANAPDPAKLTQTASTSILNNAPRWSHPPGNQVVPSPWQATAPQVRRFIGPKGPDPREAEQLESIEDRRHLGIDVLNSLSERVHAPSFGVNGFRALYQSK